MKNSNYSEEKTLYIIGIIGIFCILIFLLFLKIYNINIFNINVPCKLLEKTGYYCPGCGGTRAVKALIKGDIIGSIKYHPVVIYIFVVYSLFMILNTMSLIFKRDFSGMKLNNTIIILMPIIIFGQFFIKNILLIVWNIRII